MKPSVDIVIPVYNEEKDLPRSILILTEFLQEHIENPWRIVIADNGSTDSTLSIAEMLSSKYEGVTYLHLGQKGRGRALRRAWLESQADIVSYMDVDLSTDLNAFPKLLEALEEGYDIATGTRLGKGAQVRRSLEREVISRGYNLLVKALFLTRFTDAQCGFKALRREVASLLVPLIRDQGFFFDSELLIIAEKQGVKIKEVPVEWVEDPDTRVNIPRTVWMDLRGLLRLRFGGIPKPPSEASKEGR
ncbi:MAG: dolichyl-phosphate beta-glucosyltransferase [Dehalococcoidia bacterium]